MFKSIKDESKLYTWQLFDRISARYDLLNRVLSIGIDRYWRKKISTFLQPKKRLQVLDLATGTGDVMFSLVKQKPDQFESLIGIDLSEKMMDVGREKSKKYNLNSLITFKRGDAEDIPLETESVDLVTMAFGIRNVSDVSKTLEEIYRVIKAEGQIIILEFSLPTSPLVKQIYLYYFRNILPRIGGVLSGDYHAYHYLNQSVESFPYGKQFADLLENSNFKKIKMQPLNFGIATLYIGYKL